MALKNDLEELKKELAFLDDQFKSVGQALKDNISVEMENLDEATKKVVKSFQQDFTRAVSSSNKALDNQAAIREKILKGQNASKDIEKELQKVQKQREVTSRKLENLRTLPLPLFSLNLERNFKSLTLIYFEFKKPPQKLQS